MPASPISALALLPEIILLLAGCAVLLIGQAKQESSRRLAPWVALLSLVVAFVAALVGPKVTELWFAAANTAGSGLACGSLAQFVRISALEIGILLTLINWHPAREKERGEFLAMMLFSLTGLLLVGSADNLLLLFLAVELVSIPTYVMVILSRTHVGALEAGTKYFFLGALAAALTAYGFSFLYGVSGTASLSGTVHAVADALRTPGNLEYGLALIGSVLAIGGLLFKIAAVPLHFYVADVYQGAASPVAGWLGFVPKLAGLVAIFKLIRLTGFWDDGDNAVFWLLWLVAALSMTVGNVLALRQTNIKRLLGYSGVAHAGYMLVGVLAGPLAGKAVAAGGVALLGDGTAAVLYYVVIYGLANLGAFAVLGLLRVRAAPCETLRDVAGLLRRQPGAALLLSLALLTLMGLPPTPGFWGKFALFGSALTASRLTPGTPHATWLLALVVIAVLNSALAAAYYLRVIAAALLYENERPAHVVSREAPQIGAWMCGILLLVFTFFPSGLMSAGQTATADLIPPAASASSEPDYSQRAGPPDTSDQKNSVIAFDSMSCGLP